MGKCMKKCRRFEEVALMEVTQVVGMRTRARSLALAATEVKLSRKRKAILQLKSRSLVMKLRNQSKLARDDSTTSSMSSCEAVEEDLEVHTPCEDAGSSMCEFENSLDRREICSSNNRNVYSERKSGKSTTTEFRTPSASEIEEFFTVAEKSEKHRFVSRYNFDVDNEVPLEGRYDWVRVNE